jgi:hypothetical protein
MTDVKHDALNAAPCVAAVVNTVPPNPRIRGAATGSWLGQLLELARQAKAGEGSNCWFLNRVVESLNDGDGTTYSDSHLA